MTSHLARLAGTWIAFLVATCSVGLGPAWVGADNGLERGTLKGLGGVEVLVEPLPPEPERDGLTRSQLQSDVEARLRQSGIRVLTPKEARYTPGFPTLYIQVTTSKKTQGLYAYGIRIELQQHVRLARDPTIEYVAATTWTTGYSGMVGERELAAVRDDVRGAVDEFVHAYLSANPKP